MIPSMKVSKVLNHVRGRRWEDPVVLFRLQGDKAFLISLDDFMNAAGELLTEDEAKGILGKIQKRIRIGADCQ